MADGKSLASQSLEAIANVWQIDETRSKRSEEGFEWWPGDFRVSVRGILAAACRLRALDFATGEPLGSANIQDRHYHHVFPDAPLKEADINSSLALNCALITDTTNISIGRKDPLDYLKDRYKWTSKSIVSERLQSHLIPIKELANGGYSELDRDTKIAKLKSDFEAFTRARSHIIMSAVKFLAAGRQLSLSDFYPRDDNAAIFGEMA